MKRDFVIDIAKGIGILLVVFAHIYKGDLQSIIYLFHMPLFFMLTGCALSYSKANTVKWERLYNGIIVPYLCISFITYVYWVLVECRFRPLHNGEVIPWLSNIVSFKWQQFINIFTAMDTDFAFIYNVVLWFLPCLFVSRVLFAALNKNKYFIVCIPILAFIAVLYIDYDNPPLPWCMELAAVSLPFVLIGQKFYQLYKPLTKKVMTVNTIGGGFLLIFINYYTDISINMYEHGLADGWIYLTGIIGGVFIISLSTLITNVTIRKPLLYLGRNSLLIMCLHEPIKRIVIKVFSVFTGLQTDCLRQDFLMSMAVLFTIIMVLIPCIYTANRWTSWIVGERRL